MTPSRGRVVVIGGLRVVYRAAGPASPTFVFAHATGFCAGVWRPVIDDLLVVAPGAGIVAMNQRAHGGSDVGGYPFDWWDVGRDLLSVLDGEAPERPLIGVGHSGGGAGLALASLERPSAFDGLVLIEPIITPPPHLRGDGAPIVLAAQRRRPWFASRDEARERWRHRGVFRGWDDRALDGYVDGGLIPGVDPDTGEPGVVLACRPEAEAEWFRAGTAHGGWDRLEQIEVPVVIVAGTASATHGSGLAERQSDRIPGSTLRMVDGGSHFIPMEKPAVVVEEALAMAERLSPR